MNTINNNLTDYSSNLQTQPNENNYTIRSNYNSPNMFDYTNNITISPILIFILVFVVIIYLVLFFSLGDNNSNSNSDNDWGNNSGDNIAFKIITIIIIFLFLFLVGLNIAQYYFGVDIIASVKNLFSNQPEINIAVNTPADSLSTNNQVPKIRLNKQVFNIPGNNYNFSDAKALCSAYGAELANYKQIENAYDNGAEWCNYGWSEGQMALFPTQTSSFEKLQKIQGHENDCGRPGINGGVMANPDLKFGVNCFGYKPVMTNNEGELMHQLPNYPKTMKDIEMEERVNYWKDKIPDILVSPFNHNNWSKI